MNCLRVQGGRRWWLQRPKFIPKEAVQITLGDGIQAKCAWSTALVYGRWSSRPCGKRGRADGKNALVRKRDSFYPGGPDRDQKGDRRPFYHWYRSNYGWIHWRVKTICYIDAEKQTVDELKKLGKPFILLLNSTKPHSDEVLKLAEQLSEEYEVTVLPVSCEQLKKEDIFHILESVLKEFPVTELDFHIPKWLEVLPASTGLRPRW